MDNIEKHIKNGRLDLAISELEAYAKSIGADEEMLSDIIVLNSNISNLKRQEKRKTIEANEVRNATTTYSYEITDILNRLEQEFSGQNVTPVTTRPDNSPVTGKPTETGSPVIQSNININIDISNQITNEIKIEIQGLKEGFDELKSYLSEQDDEASKEAIKNIDDLSTDIDQLENATDKSKLPGILGRIQDFFKRLEDGNDTVTKAISVTKHGIKTIKKIAKNYNNIAQWIGLPMVPPLFTK